MTCEAPASPASSIQHAESLMRRRRWAEAAEAFSQIEPRDAATEMKRLLSGNLATLKTHRPEIYQQLIALPTTESFGIAAAAEGRPTVAARRPDGSAVSLSGGPDPLAAAHAAFAQVKSAAPNGESVGLCGIGDGYLLQLLAQNPPKLFMDTEQAVFVLEPEPQVLLHALMIHDFAGPAGPIALERFRWFVGPTWADVLDNAVRNQPSIALPTVTLQQGLDSSAILARVHAGLKALADRDAEDKRNTEAYYATLTPVMLAELTGSHPPRKPRVMLLTTRFSTVLQYSTHDTAGAFRALGWDALVLIEPGPSHRLYQHTIRRALAEFRPDIVFQIDHLRHEHRDLFPQNLPFVCWGQDHLPNLITPDAGRRVGELDFVLTDNPVAYARNYAYPPRQLISTPKLTAPSKPSAVPQGPSAVEDVVFVSNASRTPEHLLEEPMKGWDGSEPALHVLLECAHRILATYATGGTISTYGEIRGLLHDALASRGIELSAAESLRVSKWLTHPFNDALYRQQALNWAARACQKLGLTLGLYGNGWDEHPDFADHGRGPIPYGEPLRDLTRRAKVNLQIVPYLCLHQRLLDGLSAGGFFLVRQNPNDIFPQTLLNFLDRHAPGAQSTDDARGALDPSLLAEFEALLDAAALGTISTDGEDVVPLVRDWADAGNLQTGGDVLPRLCEVSFDNEQQLSELLARLGNDRDLRAELAAEQRNAVVARMSYTAGIKRVTNRIAALLRETAERSSQGVRKCA